MPQITPGTSFIHSVDPSIGDTAGPQESNTMNPCPPVEWGRSYTRTDAQAQAGSQIPSGGLVNIGTVTMTGAASTEENSATQYSVANPDGNSFEVKVLFEIRGLEVAPQSFTFILEPSR